MNFSKKGYFDDMSVVNDTLVDILLIIKVKARVGNKNTPMPKTYGTAVGFAIINELTYNLRTEFILPVQQSHPCYTLNYE